ncbi:methionine biosynthesis protein MetW [Vitreimonas sp.]|uniref:methionine biosynthesis protein MetW n=1 Tax=Vitreimonas sp. TaxID=3069702 RepID=UPI002EDB9379
MAQLELVHPAPIDFDAPLSARGDHNVIAHMISEGARVLDIGSGDGALISLLTRECGARARGLEIDPAKVHACVKRGLSVVQGDADHDLTAFPSASFEYVVFSRTLQRLRDPEAALREAARIGERVIVTIANSGHWSGRFELMFGGRIAKARRGREILHPLSVRDFVALARGLRMSVERALPLARNKPGAPFAKVLWRANWFAEEAVFLLTP